MKNTQGNEDRPDTLLEEFQDTLAALTFIESVCKGDWGTLQDVIDTADNPIDIMAGLSKAAVMMVHMTRSQPELATEDIIERTRAIMVHLLATGQVK